MNNKEKELLNAINGTERMSSYDGEDMSYFDDMDSFDGDDMSYADGDYENTSGSASQKYTDPYILQYANTDTIAHTAILFGYNKYSGSVNFGNNALVTITNLNGGTYGQMFNQSANKQFVITKWRFVSTMAGQLSVTLQITHTEANGKQTTTPFNLDSLRDMYAQQGTIVEGNKPVTVDGNTELSFTLLAGAQITITMYPSKINSIKAKLGGGNQINTSRNPRTSALNAPVTLIQTSSGVKGITRG